MNLRAKIAARLIATHILLVAGLIVLAASVASLLCLSIAQTVLLIVYLSGYWEFFGLRFKRLFLFLAETAILVILCYRLFSGCDYDMGVYLAAVLSAIQLYTLTLLIKMIIVIFRKDRVFMEIAFPFRKGTYLITDGGNSKISRLMNYHYYAPVHKKNKTNLSMLYATDIVKLTDRANWLPRRNEQYPVYEEPVYSPIEGRVVKVITDIDDNVPYCGPFPYNTGNTVVIQKDTYFLLLGHLKKDSILVEEGDMVRANELIAAAGNSGWTERPHLHMQLVKSDSANYWLGVGIEMRFRNKTLVKNSIIKN